MNLQEKKAKETVQKIMDFASIVTAESDKLIADYDKFNAYIEPLFLAKFGHRYESSLHSMYSGERRQFLDLHKEKIKSL